MARSGSASTSLSSLTPTSGSSAESSPVRGEGREKDARGAKRAGTQEYEEDFEEDADELGMDEDDEDDQEDGDEDYVESRRVSARKKLATPSRRSARSSTTTTTTTATTTTTPNSAKSKTASTRQFSQRGRTTTPKDATRGSTTGTLQQQQQHPQQQQQQYPTRAHIQGQGFQTQPHVTSHWGVTGNKSTSSAPGPAQRKNLGQSPDLDESENLGGRSRNALAQAKHRAKRKAYIKQVGLCFFCY